MAYGLDVEAVYFTDKSLTDIGIIDTYEISVDLAGEKDFQIKTANYTLPIGGFWYIQDTEYGGVIRGKRTQSQEEEATYTGKSWRGILHEHIVDVPDKNDSRFLQGNISTVVNNLLKEEGLDGLFICEQPDIDESVSAFIDLISITRGTTLYDAMWQIARSINFNYVFEYRNKKMHLTPILSEDYSDYMVYSSIGALAFDMQEQTGYVNHYIMTSVSETGQKRTIHLFTNGEGAIMPHAKTDTPIQDSDYILDTSQQVMFGVDEVAQYEETEERVVENYKLVEKAPTNWNKVFGNYFYKEVEDGSEVFSEYEAEDEIKYTLLTKKPDDWSKNFSSYFDRQIGQSGEYEYVSVSATTTQDVKNAQRIWEIPIDWKTDYSQYFYQYESGTGTVYENYSGVEKYKYTLLTAEPSDWRENWENYYRRVIKVLRSVTKGPKMQFMYVDVYKNGHGTYVDLKTISEGQAGPAPIRPNWKPGIYYRKDSYTVPPEFEAYNTWIVPNKEVAPTWKANTFYKEETVWIPPIFAQGNVYEKVMDHYADMVADGISFLETQVNSKTQNVTMGNFIVNIGDTVGGRDEFTGESIIAEISNINADIKNGMLEVEYVIGG